MIFKGTGINVTTIGQIDTKTQYSMKRKEFRQPHYLAESSLGGSKSDFIQNSSIQKPLQGSVHSHISFKGFDLNSVAKFLNPVIKPVPRKLTSKVFESLKNISDAQYKYYSDIRKEYVDFIKVHSTPPKDELEKIKREAPADRRSRVARAGGRDAARRSALGLRQPRRGREDLPELRAQGEEMGRLRLRAAAAAAALRGLQPAAAQGLRRMALPALARQALRRRARPQRRADTRDTRGAHHPLARRTE